MARVVIKPFLRKASVIRSATFCISVTRSILYLQKALLIESNFRFAGRMVLPVTMILVINVFSLLTAGGC